MAIVLFNPTDEELRAQYGGVDVKIAPFGKEGHLVRVEDQKARHILNILGPRGLTTLEFGDEGEIKEQKAADGRRRAEEFKQKQVRTYNRDNEGRKMRNLEYVEPPEKIKQWAKDLGIILIQPYELPDVDMQEMANLRKEKKELLGLVADLKESQNEIMNMLKQKGLLEEPEDPHEELKETYNHMNREQLAPWVENLTFDKFSQYPVEVQKDIMTKWEGFWNKEEKPFPY